MSERSNTRDFRPTAVRLTESCGEKVAASVLVKRLATRLYVIICKLDSKLFNNVICKPRPAVKRLLTFSRTKSAVRTTLSACIALLNALPTQAVEVSGLLDLRLATTNARQSWVNGGLDKTRFDSSGGALRLGQAMVRIEADLLDAVSAVVVVSASDDRMGVLDLTEAFLTWRPVPTSPWKTRVRAGAFFPVTSLEIGYDSVGWTPQNTVSSSAINSWLGEELRTQGVEINVSRNGRSIGSPHDFGVTAALFAGNDPVGTLLAWRGWSVGDRISGLTESLQLPDLPVYRAQGELPDQSRAIHLFREIDNHLGFYVAGNYAYGGALELAAMHYDNRGDPLVLRSGQYSWRTRFDHLSLRWRGLGQWEFAAQVLKGDTLMGPSAVHLDYSAWYVLLSHPLGPGTATLRFDRFGAQERQSDAIRTDPNSEDGQALALAYHWRITPALSLVSELLAVQSDRPARRLNRQASGQATEQTERSFTAALRWHF